MIINLEQFVRDEEPYWIELEELLTRAEADAAYQMDLAAAQRFYYLYRRAVSGLARLRSFAEAPAAVEYLEAIVARAYPHVHPPRRKATRFRPFYYLFVTFPRTVRRRRLALLMSVFAFTLGSLFGCFAMMIDPEAKNTLMPFSHLMQDPSDRVAEEENPSEEKAVRAQHSSFAAMLMTNNIRVSIMAMAFGIAWGLGTFVMLFYNGVILGSVAFDYVQAGEGLFLMGWLLPHGAIEIPSILLAGQAGFVLGHAVLGYGSALTLRERMRLAAPDIVALVVGLAVMLVWAGIIESFLSQYHAPVLPYSAKIAFGMVELALLALFLTLAGREPKSERKQSMELRHA